MALLCRQQTKEHACIYAGVGVVCVNGIAFAQQAFSSTCWCVCAQHVNLAECGAVWMACLYSANTRFKDGACKSARNQNRCLQTATQSTQAHSLIHTFAHSHANTPLLNRLFEELQQRHPLRPTPPETCMYQRHTCSTSVCACI